MPFFIKKVQTNGVSSVITYKSELRTSPKGATVSWAVVCNGVPAIPLLEFETEEIAQFFIDENKIEDCEIVSEVESY